MKARMFSAPIYASGSLQSAPSSDERHSSSSHLARILRKRLLLQLTRRKDQTSDACLTSDNASRCSRLTSVAPNLVSGSCGGEAGRLLGVGAAPDRNCPTKTHSGSPTNLVLRLRYCIETYQALTLTAGAESKRDIWAHLYVRCHELEMHWANPKV
jgi:hypothetical protein